MGFEVFADAMNSQVIHSACLVGLDEACFYIEVVYDFAELFGAYAFWGSVGFIAD
ncbi:MAG: hypothetical protein ACQCN3_15550 [Candidatus Bathyarchaeia archaeon]